PTPPWATHAVRRNNLTAVFGGADGIWIFKAKRKSRARWGKPLFLCRKCLALSKTEQIMI
ncbi:hypothetical protein, partial [Lentibacter sp.]|uniref:hypothetical protein n=1 Tax=Lentibacter sp. TaxID=2024994 RepID=UPI003F698887